MFICLWTIFSCCVYSIFMGLIRFHLLNIIRNIKVTLVLSTFAATPSITFILFLVLFKVKQLFGDTNAQQQRALCVGGASGSAAATVALTSRSNSSNNNNNNERKQARAFDVGVRSKACWETRPPPRSLCKWDPQCWTAAASHVVKVLLCDGSTS